MKQENRAMDDTRIETPEALALRLIGDGDGATQIAMRNIAAEVIRARDAGVAAWCERKAAAAQRAADEEEAELAALGMRPDRVARGYRDVRMSTFRFVASALVAK